VSLTAADVAELMRLVEQSGFDELTLEMDGMKINLRRGAAPASSWAEPETPTIRPPPRSEPVENVPADADPNVYLVTSPLLGTVYRAPKPGAAPFVEVGVQVEEDTVVAIIEVMKLMNTVRAGVRGTVTDILVTDGQLAEYGQALMRVRKPG
jgi:acetyl-CoA carboxylase biotin carboxyl carrier protein